MKRILILVTAFWTLCSWSATFPSRWTTNVDGAAIDGTPIILGGYTNIGTINSNSFNRVQIAQADNGYFSAKPPLFIDSFYLYGSVINSTTISNQLSAASATYGTNAAQNRLWDIWFIVDDGWQGGITNGILMPNPAVLNITNICTHAHANGCKIMLYVEPTALSSSGFPTLGTNWQANAKVWAAWGIDGIKVDMTAGDPFNFADKITLFSELIAEARKGYVNPLMVYSGGWRDTVNLTPGQTNGWLDQVSEIANVTRVVTDNLGDWFYFCTNIVDCYSRNYPLNKRGHWLDLDHMATFDSSVGQPGTNFSRGEISTFAMFSLPMQPALLGDPVGDPVRYFNMTRPDIVKLDSDPLYAPAVQIYSNNSGSVYTRPLSWGGKAILMLNRQTNSFYTTNVNWVDIGYPSNQLCGIYDVWNGQILSNTYGSFSMSVSNWSAFAYYIYPTNNNPATFYPVDIPFQNWFSVDASPPTWTDNNAGLPVLLFTVKPQRVEFPIPKTLVTTTKLQCICRINASGAGTVKLYWIVGTEANNSFANNGAVFSVATAGTAPLYFTNVFTVVANPDSCGMRIGLDTTDTLNMNLYNITVQAQ